jgi:hypothetical protein
MVDFIERSGIVFIRIYQRKILTGLAQITKENVLLALKHIA